MQTILEARQKLREQSGREEAERFARTYAEAQVALAALTEASSVSLVRILRRLRISAVQLINSLGIIPSDITTTLFAAQLARDVLNPLSDFGREAVAEIGNGLTSASELGGRVTATALNRVGIPIAFPAIPPDVLAAAGAAVDSAITELISGAGGLSDRIARELRLAAIGSQPISGAILRIERLLRGSEEVRRGLRRRIGFGFQAETIARTEIGRVFSTAQQAASEQISNTIPGLRKRWVTVAKERRGHRDVERRYNVGGEIGPILVKQRFVVTDFTRTGRTSFLTIGGRIRPEVGGQRVVGVPPYRRRGRLIRDRMLHPRDPAGSAGNVINCLLPGNKIEGDFLAGLKSWYSGPAYEIKMASGKRLTLTANHPVPTMRGFVGAHQVQKGDRLFKNTLQRRFPFDGVGKHYHKQGPATVEDVFKTLRVHGSVRTVRTGSLDFDGDGRRMTGDVDIVGTDWVLLENIETMIQNMVSNEVFVSSLMCDSKISSSGTLNFFVDRMNASFRCGPCGRTLTLDGISSLRSDGLPCKSFSFGNTTRLDALLFKNPLQRGARDVKLLCDVTERFPSEMTLDDVVDVKVFPFSGHVYDFKTTSSLIRCQDIFISNCTCVIQEILPEMAGASDRARGIIQ